MKLKELVNKIIIQEMKSLKEAGLDTGTRTIGGSYLDREQNLFDAETAPALAKRLFDELDAPVISPKVSTLGGARNASILMKISLDPKDSWGNGIYENSRNMAFHISSDGVVEQFTISKVPVKFRKIRVKTPDDLISKLNQYLNKVK